MTLSHEDVERILDDAFIAAGVVLPDCAAIKVQERKSPPTVRLARINAAIECARRGMNRSETARSIGMSPPNFYKFQRDHLSDVTFSSHRRKRAKA